MFRLNVMAILAVSVSVGVSGNFSSLNKSLNLHRLLRDRFDLLPLEESMKNPVFHDDNMTHILMPTVPLANPIRYQFRRTPTTFRPSSAILYLHPPRPKHIESIESELSDIDLSARKISVSWKVYVKLRKKRSIGDEEEKKSNAKIYRGKDPLQWNFFLRKYGFVERKKFRIADGNETILEQPPPVVDGNLTKNYRYELDELEPYFAYEFCIQSVNAGEIRQSDQIRRRFPVDAITELSGRNNPAFLCKEIVLPRESNHVDVDDDGNISNEEKFSGRYRTKSFEQQPSSSSSVIEITDDVTDAFVLYTAITTGSTTVFILAVVVVCCCCRCRTKRINDPATSSSMMIIDEHGGYSPVLASNQRNVW